MIQIPGDREFLHLQRQRGESDIKAGVDRNLMDVEDWRYEHKMKLQEPRRKIAETSKLC